MAFNNLTLPTLITEVGPGAFGALEGRLSHYGAVNVLYNNAEALFGPGLIAEIQKQPYTREIKIPIFNNYNHTVLTVRSCDFVCQDNSATLKTLTRTHLAIDICINPSDFDNNYVKWARAWKHRYEQAKKAVYTKLDEMSAAFFDLNKDTTWVPDAGGATPNANPLYKQKAGAIEIPTSLKFYSFLQTIMEQKDISGPFIDLANTVALAEQNLLNNPGGGTTYATDKLMKGANISEFEYSNRVAAGVTYPVHYIAPKGSVGMINMIDPVYQDKPVMGSPEAEAYFDAFKNMSEYKIWGQIPDEVYNDWNWGVLLEASCVNETIQYKTKLSADWTLASDFTSTTGESPIKRIDITALAA